MLPPQARKGGAVGEPRTRALVKARARLTEPRDDVSKKNYGPGLAGVAQNTAGRENTKS